MFTMEAHDGQKRKRKRKKNGTLKREKNPAKLVYFGLL